MKKLLTLCTKNLHFLFNNEIYIQIDGVAMGSPLGPVIAHIFMADLKTTWWRLVDDSFAHVKIGSVEYVLSFLNSFHKNIKLTYEEEQNKLFDFAICWA